jgi:hypothetical protein
MSGDDGLKEIEEAIVRGDTERSFQLVQDALGDMDPLAIIQGGMMPAMEKVGDRFSTNGALPIDSEFTCALGHGMAGITRKEANQIIKRLMDTYVATIKNPPKGRILNECYDIRTMKPDEELRRMYDQVTRELWGLGIRFK